MFSGKVVLVTGSSSGIGAATAIHFAKLGASVIITGRNVEKLNNVAKHCKEVNNIQPLVIVGNLSNEVFIRTLLEKTIKHFTKLDILVNNAGIGGFGSIETTLFEQYKTIMALNLRSVFYLTTLATPYLIETKGAIINVSSVAGLQANPSALAYSMSKAGLHQFTQCIALELARKGVRVNCVSPGPVYTDICQNSGMGDEQTKLFYQLLGNNVPMKRVGSAEEIATTIAFLASDKSSFITGLCLPVDAGYHIGYGNFDFKEKNNS